MTPKEKAEELIAKFMPHSSGNSNNNEAKQCALIAVDEIMKELFVAALDSGYNYYRKVKQQIEKL